MKFAFYMLCIGATVMTAQARVIVAVGEKSVRRGQEPRGLTDNWLARSDLLSGPGFNNFSFVLISPCGIWHGVKDGKFYQAYRPRDINDNWLARAHLIGSSGWDNYKFLFFAPTGDLYGITHSGEFYTREAPLYDGDNWMYRNSRKIGSSGWDQFKFVFFDPKTHELYAQGDGSFYRGPEPTEANDTADAWKERAIVAGTLQWDIFQHLFCDRDGTLYGVDKCGGFWRANPVDADGKFTNGALQIGEGWDNYKFLFFRL